MKKTLRVGCRIAGGLTALVAVVLLMTLEGVDHRPYMREAYYAETVARLRVLTTTNHAVSGELSAGFGRAKLTPTLNAPQDDPEYGMFRGLPLAGYGDRHGRLATGVHDDLYIKAAAFRVGDRVGVMVGADALIIPPEVTEAASRQLAQEFHLSRAQLYLSATHSHSSLGGWGEGFVGEAFAGGFQPGVRIWFADRIVAAVREAMMDLKPASFGHGRFTVPQWVRNRVVGQLGKVDPEFSYVLVKQHDGPLAVLGSYAAHATVLSSDMMEFSADYPGCWQRAIEQATGGMALFLAGSVGSHSPVPGGSGFAGAKKMGEALADALLERISRTALTNRVTFGVLGLDLTMPPLNVRLRDGIRLRPWLAQRLLRAPAGSYIQAFRFDDVLWVSTPCDFSGELTLGIKDSFRVRGRDVAITSFNGGYVGYVIPSRYYHLDGYEPRLMSFFGPNVPDYFDEMIRSIGLSLVSD